MHFDYIAMDSSRYRKKVGHRIKVRRAELDITQKQLGAALGVDQALISGWESGRRALRIEQAANLASELKISLAYLVGESEKRAG